MNIYLASSWKNATQVKEIKSILEGYGHNVDAFCDNSGDRFVFSFNEIEDIHKHNAKTVMRLPYVQRVYMEDKKWLDWCDAVVLILPSGKSAHLEAGYAKGQGKKLVIYQPQFPDGEFDVMYGFADLITDKFGDVINFLHQADAIITIAPTAKLVGITNLELENTIKLLGRCTSDTSSRT